MAYKVKHVESSHGTNHEALVQEVLDQLGEEEIYSVQHSIATREGYSDPFVSTLIVYRDYEDTV